ncbi:hypothetical protein B0H14DRAFT_2635571 [Mycena olivaceomarginata]|nr:hypothetical protein B0H14DRAFT_2635571 [Mycena olivaceomarginata]
MYGDKPVDAVDLFRFGTHLWVVLQITVLPEALLHFTDVDDADHAIQSGRGYCKRETEVTVGGAIILQKLLAGANRQVKTSYFSHPWENLSNLRHACRKGQVKFKLVRTSYFIRTPDMPHGEDAPEFEQNPTPPAPAAFPVTNLIRGAINCVYINGQQVSSAFAVPKLVTARSGPCREDWPLPPRRVVLRTGVETLEASS